MVGVRCGIWSAGHVFVEGADQFGLFFRIARSGMGGLTNGRGGEGALHLFFATLECLVFQKSGGAEGIEKMLLDLADLQLAGFADEVLAQVETAVRAIEKLEGGEQTGRNNQRGVRVLKRIADHEAGLFRDRGRKKVETGAQARQHGFPSLQV